MDFVNAMEGQAYSFTEYHKSETVTDARKPIVRSYPWRDQAHLDLLRHRRPFRRLGLSRVSA